MKTWIVRPATTKMLASLYEVSRRIMNKHIALLGEKIGKKTGYYWTTHQVITIIEYLGPPPDCDVIHPPLKK